MFAVKVDTAATKQKEDFMEMRVYKSFVVLVRAIAPMLEKLIRTSFVSISAQDNR